MKVSGPGVEKTGVQPGKPTWFTINASEAGKGDVQVKVEPVGKSLSLLSLRTNHSRAQARRVQGEQFAPILSRLFYK